MLYDLNFLSEGETFPPKSELTRLDAYRVNDMLLNDEPWSALPEYKQRILELLSRFALYKDETCYFYTANYWAELSDKVRELLFGDCPEIHTSAKESEENVKSILKETDFMQKCDEGVSDLVALGDWVIKIKEDEKSGKGTFINVDPSMWFPVVSRENVKEIKYHVIAWISTDNRTGASELHAQIHENGKFTNVAFRLKNLESNKSYKHEKTGQIVRYNEYTIGKKLENGSKTFDGFKLGQFNTGLNDFAIVSIANVTTSRSVYGRSDFDMITDSVIEYNTRMTLKNVVLDKHSAPIMYGPDIDNGDNKEFGNYLCVPENGVPPAYVTWDASMNANETTINAIKKDISNLSSMGTILDNDTFGESQGYDALMIKLAPALMRASRKSTKIEPYLKKVISLISQKGYTKIEADDITFVWHSGIPTTEGVRADIAAKHLATGWSKKRVLMIDYGMTEEEAENEIAQAEKESPDIPMFGISEENNEGNDEENGNVES